jgi:flagellar protein FlaG
VIDVNIGGAVQTQADISSLKSSEKMTEVAVENKGKTDTAEHKEKDKVDLESLQGLLKNVNEEMRPYDTQVQFSVHEKTNHIMIKVVNTRTNETIREIPSEKLMDIMANLLEVSGILVDIKA